MPALLVFIQLLDPACWLGVTRVSYPWNPKAPLVCMQGSMLAIRGSVGDNFSAGYKVYRGSWYILWRSLVKSRLALVYIVATCPDLKPFTAPPGVTLSSRLNFSCLQQADQPAACHVRPWVPLEQHAA